MHAGRARVPLAILISGAGSNMQALAKAARAPDYPGRVALVLSNRPAAPGLAWAAGEGLPTAAIDHRAFASRADFDAALDAALRAHGAEVVALAGFMRILGQAFIRAWAGRLVNIHPSLLPRYPGLDTHARALAAGDREAGCTVHEVTEDLDAGPIIAQARVPVLPGDSAETLAARVLEAEHRLYPEALARFLAERWGPDR